MSSFKIRQVGGARMIAAYALGLFALAWGTEAKANGYAVPTSGAALAVKNDGICTLAEAIISMSGGSSDCVDTHSEGNDIMLTQTGSVPFAGHPFQLGAGSVLTGPTSNGAVSIFTADGAPAFIEATGQNALTVSAGTFLDLFNLTWTHKGSTAGRLLMNHGTLSAFDCTFQNGNLAGLTGTSGSGGGLFNDGSATLNSCTVQNNSATTSGVGNGGGLYSTGALLELDLSVVQNNNAITGGGGGIYFTGTTVDQTGVTVNDSVIQNNVAGQGGGVYGDHPHTLLNGPNFNMYRSTVNGNKGVSAELTTVPPPSGAAIPAPPTPSCSSGEDASHAFDDNFATKWCTQASAPPSTTPAVLTYQFATPQIVTAYSITFANDAPERDPSDWTLQGSADGVSWSTLHTVTGSGGARFQTLPFGHRTSSPFVATGDPQVNNFDNGTAYKYYRLRITKNVGNGNLTQLAELALFANGRTGDGGGLYLATHSMMANITLSKNIAGCTSSACACSDAWCATTTNTSPAFGFGGGLFATSNRFPEIISTDATVAANSAAQDGGVDLDRNQADGTWDWSVIAKNTARNSPLKENDFHGNPHELERNHGGVPAGGGSLFGTSAGLVFSTDQEFGVILGGQLWEGHVCNYNACDPDVVADPLLGPLQFNGGPLPSMLTHLLQSNSPVHNRNIYVNDGGVDERGIVRGANSSDWGATDTP